MTVLTIMGRASFPMAPMRRSWSRHFSSSTIQHAPFRILFFGTDEFASTHLKALIKEKDRANGCVSSLSLVCPPDRFTGRKLATITPSETKGLAELFNIPVIHTPANAKSLADWTLPPPPDHGKNNSNDDFMYDLGVVVSFGYFIPPHIISAFRYGAINVHPSLLPKFRGAAPIQHTILRGESETGVTVQELDDKEFDAGRILAQTVVDLAPVDLPTYKDLSVFLANVGSELLIDTLQHFDQRKKDAKQQDVRQATKAPKIRKEWTELDFNTMASWQIEQLHRAVGYQYPLRTNFTFSRIKRSQLIKQKTVALQLYNIYLPDDSPLYHEEGTRAPGSFIEDPKTGALHVMCADGLVIGVVHLKAEGKKTIRGKDFVNGYEIRKSGGIFNVKPDIDSIKPGQSGVRLNKRREEFEKVIRKRLGMRRQVYDKIYKQDS